MPINLKNQHDAWKRIAEERLVAVEMWKERSATFEAESQKLSGYLRDKDTAMGVLFERLAKAGVDCSDLIS